MMNVYAGYVKEENILLQSSSGGLFTAICMVTAELEKGEWYFAGAVWNEDYSSVVHIVSRDVHCLEKMRVSKYIQSNKGTIYIQIKKLLEEGKKVLFSGTPCEVAGLYAYLGKRYPGLITVDFVCKGPGSPKLYQDYLDFLMKKKKKQKITGVNMRYKWPTLDCWIPQFMKIDFEEGSYIKEFYHTEFGQAFRLLQRPSCGECRFRKEGHLSDIVIGDYHGTGKKSKYYNHLGTSILLVNTSAGKEIADKMLQRKDLVNLYQVSLDEAMEANGGVVYPYREKFVADVRRYGMVKAVHRAVGVKDRLKFIMPSRISRILMHLKRSNK